MILELNTSFEGYTPVKVLGKSTSYREVYLAKDNIGRDVVLTVYDMNNLPEFFLSGIPELDIVPHLTNDSYPSCLNSGSYNAPDVSLRWMTSEYVESTALTDFVNSDHVRNEREMLFQFQNILLALKELSSKKGCACHNNISTDNIYVTYNGKGEMKWHLRGLNCVSEVCSGRAQFDIGVPSSLFLAPETLVGHYNVKTDIFSLGIVLSFILQGKHPWEEYMSSGKPLSAAAIVRIIRGNKPLLEMPESLKAIVARAIACRPSERYRSIGEFCQSLGQYLGCNADKNPKEDDDIIDFGIQQPPALPKTNVRIEQVRGNGFSDVAGMEQLKSKLRRNFVDIMQNRELARKFNVTPPNGILLWGPPGTGKTYISRKLAEETGMLVSLIKPSDLGNIYLHGSQSMIADLFTRSEQLAAKNNCGVLLVFDEFDSLVPRRSLNDNGSQANEVAEFLTRLNDCAEKNVFVVATTNRIDAIDPAIIRAGRIDEVIYVGLPDEYARAELLELELKERPHEEIDTAHIVSLTKGYTSSDISFIVKECARCSFQESVKADSMIKIDQAMIENVIANTRPSVSAAELRQYEQIRESFRNGGKTVSSRIGFIQ